MASAAASPLPVRDPMAQAQAGRTATSSAALAATFLMPSLVWVRVLFGLLMALYLLSWAWPSGLVTGLALTPGTFWPPHFHLWTAFTHCFIEIHLPLLVLHSLAVLLATRLLEPLWGALELLAFFVLVNVGVAVCSAFSYYLLYMLTFNTALLFQVHVCGLSGYMAGLVVAIKQAMPDHILFRSPMGKITNRNMPLTILLLVALLYAVGVLEGTYLTMYTYGLLISWIYLRFYQHHANGSKGDLADSFAFHTFFPNVLQPPMALVGAAVYAILVRLRICKKPPNRYQFGAAGPTSISISLPGMENQDSERRRQIALKALSERLTKAEPGAATGAAGGPHSTSEEAAWPSLDGKTEATVHSVPSAESVVSETSALLEKSTNEESANVANG